MIEDEEKLIRGAKQGESRAFDVLYKRYVAPIYRFVYLKVSHREEAEDLTHEVFLSAWKNIDRYKSRGFPFSSWLYQIARNRVIDHYRLKKNTLSIDVLEGETEPAETAHPVDEAIDQNIDLEKVRFAMQKLHPDQQDVLIMRFMEDLSHGEIAAALDKSEGAVRLIQHRALNELRKIINGGTNQ